MDTKLSSQHRVILLRLETHLQSAPVFTCACSSVGTTEKKKIHSPSVLAAGGSASLYGPTASLIDQTPAVSPGLSTVVPGLTSTPLEENPSVTQLGSPLWKSETRHHSRPFSDSCCTIPSGSPAPSTDLTTGSGNSPKIVHRKSASPTHSDILCLFNRQF